MSSETFKEYLHLLQKDICDKLGAFENRKSFHYDEWERPEGGGGRTAVLQGGDVFDSGGVNFSFVKGASLPSSASAHRPELAGRSFEAMGISSVIHPKNPYCPTAHMNVRLFKAIKDGHAPVWWFGGGFDLTPYYPFEDDCVQWHKIAEGLCLNYGSQVYPKYKNWADEYFYLPHRKEARGIGGLFFDDLNTEVWDWDWDKCQQFTQDVGQAFLEAYLPIITKRHTMPYGESEMAFQRYRRGRYVEFNLVYDRGTLFGLQSGGRTESILMSLPPNVSWQYNYSPEHDSKEHDIYKFLKPRDWVSGN